MHVLLLSCKAVVVESLQAEVNDMDVDFTQVSLLTMFTSVSCKRRKMREHVIMSL